MQPATFRHAPEAITIKMQMSIEYMRHPESTQKEIIENSLKDAADHDDDASGIEEKPASRRFSPCCVDPCRLREINWNVYEEASVDLNGRSVHRSRPHRRPGEISQRKRKKPEGSLAKTGGPQVRPFTISFRKLGLTMCRYTSFCRETLCNIFTKIHV